MSMERTGGASGPLSFSRTENMSWFLITISLPAASKTTT